MGTNAPLHEPSTSSPAIDEVKANHYQREVGTYVLQQDLIAHFNSQREH
ncbi:hypothetical protein [Williamsia sp. 1135]|nr:hypothetical protein [Williamsia sp. 1135]